MKRSELLTQLADAQKFGTRALVPYLAVLIGFAAVTWWIAVAKEPDANSRLPGLMMIGFIVLAYAGLFPTSILVRRFQRRTGLECPGCKKLLVGIHAQITVASGRCGRCGTIVIQDNE